MRGFVRVPNALLELSLSDRAFRYWIYVRQRNGERMAPCWESQASLQRRVSEQSHSEGTPRAVSSATKRAQKELKELGLIVVERRGIGTSAHRFALRTGIEGELELNHLLDQGEIGYQTYAEAMSRRSPEDPYHGP